MKVAVVILNYNSSKDCRKCVSDLKRQEGVDLELILVDNCSPDREKVAELCREQECTFIAAQENRGYNAGNNIGLRYAAEKGYQYALIANPDMEFPQKDYVGKLIKAMGKDDSIVVVGSDIVNSEGVHQNPLIRDGNWKSSFNWLRGFFRSGKDDVYEFIDNYMESHECARLSGCCLLVRISFIRSIGFFDEYPFLYCEEPIFSRQVERMEKRMYYVSNLMAIHRHVKSEKGNFKERFKHWKRSRLYYIEYYSDDSWFGKKISSLSVLVYVSLITCLNKIRG